MTAARGESVAICRKTRHRRREVSDGGFRLPVRTARRYAMPFSSATFTSSVRFFTPSLV